MLYVLNLTVMGGENRALNQIGKKLYFDGVEIPHLFANGKLDIRQFYINKNLIMRYKNGDVEISVDEEKKYIAPTRSTLLISKFRIDNIGEMKKIKQNTIDLFGADLADLSIVLPLGSAKGYYFTLVFATEFDFGDRDGKYCVNVPCMQYFKVK